MKTRALRIWSLPLAALAACSGANDEPQPAPAPVYHVDEDTGLTLREGFAVSYTHLTLPTKA